MITKKELTQQAIELLKLLIATPSLSGNEEQTADLIKNHFTQLEIPYKQKYNNIYACNKYYDSDNPTLLLNSHLDTVKPNKDWTYNPFEATIQDGKIFGLGSNDAGGSLVSLLATFIWFYKIKNLKYNLVFAATGEEENSGPKGLKSILKDIAPIDLAIIGEPTTMQMAIAEKGLMVLRCTAYGKSGHAARSLGENAIEKAMEDIKWFHSYRFPKTSKVLGPVKMTVTMIDAGTQHNVIPARCNFTVDIRSTDVYSNREILDIIQKNIKSDTGQPSLSLNPSGMAANHILVRLAQKMGIKSIGSPTLSDQSILTVPSVKMGPGRSERSHTADEFICISEIEDGIIKYIKLLEQFMLHNSSA